MPLRGLLSPDSFGVACQALEAYQEAAVLAYILPSAPSGERLRPSGCAPHAPYFENLTFSFFLYIVATAFGLAATTHFELLGIT